MSLAPSETDAACRDGDEAGEDAAGEPLADTRGDIRELTADEKNCGAGDALARLLNDRAGRYGRAAGDALEAEIPLHVGRDHSRNGRAVALTQERAQAFERRADGILARQLQRAAHLVADTGRKTFDGGFHGVRAIDALSDGGRDLLRLLGIDQRLSEPRPARFAAHFLNREIDALGEQLIHAETAPLAIDGRAIVERFYAGFERLQRQSFD